MSKVAFADNMMFLKYQKSYVQNQQRIVREKSEEKGVNQEFRDKIRNLSSNSRKDDLHNVSAANSIANSFKEYNEKLRMQRTQKNETNAKVKKVKYQFKDISSKILRSKTSTMAKQVVSQAKREVLRLKRQKMNEGNEDSEEIDAAIIHAKAMERVARKKARHLEEEEMLKNSNGIFNGDMYKDDETENIDEEKMNLEEDMDENIEEDVDEIAMEDAEVYETAMDDSYMELENYDLLSSLEALADQDFTEDMFEELGEELEAVLEEFGFESLDETAVLKDATPEDLKELKMKHRNKEMKDIIKADADYLKAIFDYYEKCKSTQAISGVSMGNTETFAPVSVTPMAEVSIDITV